MARVVAHKVARANDELGDIHIASRTLEKCRGIVESINAGSWLKKPGVLQAHQLDVFDVEATKALIARTGVGIVINVGSAFLNMSVLRACIETGAAYIDTAIHEDAGKVCEAPPWYGSKRSNIPAAFSQKGLTSFPVSVLSPGLSSTPSARVQRSWSSRLN